MVSNTRNTEFNHSGSPERGNASDIIHSSQPYLSMSAALWLIDFSHLPTRKHETTKWVAQKLLLCHSNSWKPDTLLQIIDARLCILDRFRARIGCSISLACFPQFIFQKEKQSASKWFTTHHQCPVEHCGKLGEVYLLFHNAVYLRSARAEKCTQDERLWSEHHAR